MFYIQVTHKNHPNKIFYVVREDTIPYMYRLTDNDKCILHVNDEEIANHISRMMQDMYHPSLYIHTVCDVKDFRPAEDAINPLMPDMETGVSDLYKSLENEIRKENASE